tara:strand:- start:343 stop:654 length:312 start_codon:yes stop_codon:yes gene_type:complete
MKKEPYLRNENPDEMREVLYLEVKNLRDLSNKEDLKEIKINLENIIQRTDQKNLRELIEKGIENLDNDKIKSSVHYLNMALRMLGHTFTEDEDIENSTFIDNE